MWASIESSTTTDPEEFLFRAALLWQHTYRPKSPPARKPSWTWTSHDFPVEWHHLDLEAERSRETPTFRERSIFHKGNPADPFGHIDGGYLVIEGFVYNAVLHVYQRSVQELWDATEKFKIIARDIRPDYHWRPKTAIHISCLNLGRRGPGATFFLLLKRCSEEQGCFERIGIAEVPRGETHKLQWFKTGIKNTIKIC